MLKISQLKKDLQNGDINSSIEYLSSATDVSVFRLFKENKLLLLIGRDRATLLEKYEETAKRLIVNQQQLDIELHYLSFLDTYLLATAALKKQVYDLISPYLNRNLKDFLLLTFKHIELYESQLTKHLYEVLKDKPLNDIPSDELSEFYEWNHSALRGRLLDMLFAESNLINLFGEWKGNNSEEEFIGIYEVEEVEAISDMLMLSANMNSYQFALDKISYGEWSISNITLLNGKPVFTFQIIDVRLEKARDLGLKRETSDRMFVKRRNRRWLRDILTEFASEAFDEAWDYYQNTGNIFLINNQEYRKGKERMLKSLDILDVEDELLVGMNHEVEIISAYLVACTLLAFTTAAEYLKHKSNKHIYTYTCPEIPKEQINRLIERMDAFGQSIVNCLDLFICQLPLKQHLDLFKTPFIQDPKGKVFAIDYLSGEWTTLVRSFLMQGGKTADVVGKSWEGYVADIMRKNHWQKVIQGLKIKKDGKLLTDIDIVAKRDDVLFVIQMKVYYGTGINNYEQWKFRNKLEQAIKQVRLSERSISYDIRILKPYFTDAEVKDIKRIQPIVMTNAHIYNGWKHENVPVMSIGSLMQIINGAIVKFERTDGLIVSVKKYIASDIVSNNEFIEFLENPLDWRIGDPQYLVKYHKESFEHSTLLFPLWTNKEGGNSMDLFMA